MNQESEIREAYNRARKSQLSARWVGIVCGVAAICVPVLLQSSSGGDHFGGLLTGLSLAPLSMMLLVIAIVCAISGSRAGRRAEAILAGENLEKYLVQTEAKDLPEFSTDAMMGKLSKSQPLEAEDK